MTVSVEPMVRKTTKDAWKDVYTYCVNQVLLVAFNSGDYNSNLIKKNL